MRVMIMLLCMLLAGCAVSQTELAVAPYLILNSSAYTPDSCVSTSHGESSASYRTGLALVAIDNDTGAHLQASGTWRYSLGSGGIGANYSCVEGINDTATRVTVSSRGHVPKTFAYEPLKDSLTILQVPLYRSGTVASDCKEFLSAGTDASQLESIAQTAETMIARAVAVAGINESYNVTYSECSGGRGGYVKVKGITQDSQFDIYYRSGWCSSGGSDCGYSVCLSTTDAALFATSKQMLCRDLREEVLENGPICTGPQADNSTEVRAACAAGAYEQVMNGIHTIAFHQDSNRCSSSVRVGMLDCMAS